MTTQVLFLFGVFVSALVALGMWLTLLEFKKSESGQVPRNPSFPL
jgi:hypothetical protein